MLNQLEKIEKRFIELEDEISKPEVSSDINHLQKLVKERAGIEDVVTAYRSYKETAKSLEETKKIISFIKGEIDANELLIQFEGRYSGNFDPDKDLKKIGVVNQTTMLATETQEIADRF